MLTFFTFPLNYWQLRVAKAQSTPPVTPQPSVSKSISPVSDWNHVSQPTTQQETVSSYAYEKSWADTGEEISAVEDEGHLLTAIIMYLLYALGNHSKTKPYRTN